jgi:SAM-dependent methyltransferase
MATQGSLAAFETFDNLNVEYEHAYEDNKFKKACIAKAISMLPSGSRVLDVGCGTGVPVADMLAKAGLDVVGFDISPKMTKLAQARVKGLFTVSDMLNYEIEGRFAGVFMIFAHLQLSYADFHSAAYKYANALQPGGILALGQMPSDIYVKDDSYYDETKAYVEDYDVPFMGGLLPTLMLSAEGQRNFLISMGLEIVWDQIDTFQPRNEKCKPEEQQYIIARRPDEQTLALPKPPPKTRT